MDITVNAQKDYSYIIWPIFVAIAAVLFVALIIFLIKIMSKPPAPAQPIDGTMRWRALSENEKYFLRMKYLQLLDELNYKVANKEISVRHCYQLLSRYLRTFVSDITGVKVNKCTLSDIKQMNMPALAVLMEEYYGVEFSKYSDGDAAATIDRTKRVISAWN